MGKSVLLAILAMQFRRYFGSRIFAFDMGRSMRATILGLGGEHYDLGADGGIAFQPLVRIDSEGYRTWARSEEHTSELQSLMRISYAVFCLKKKKTSPYSTTSRIH